MRKGAMSFIGAGRIPAREKRLYANTTLGIDNVEYLDKVGSREMWTRSVYDISELRNLVSDDSACVSDMVNWKKAHAVPNSGFIIVHPQWGDGVYNMNTPNPEFVPVIMAKYGFAEKTDVGIDFYHASCKDVPFIRLCFDPTNNFMFFPGSEDTEKFTVDKRLAAYVMS
jgi:hypothetical protein